MRCTAICRGPQLNADGSIYQRFTSAISLSPGCHTSRVRPRVRGVPRQTTDDGRSVIWAVLATSHGSSLCGRPLHSPLAPSGDRYIDSWLIRRTTVLVGIRYISRENSRFLPMLSCLKMCSVIIETIVYNLFRFYMLKKACCCVDASFSTKEASTQ